MSTTSPSDDDLLDDQLTAAVNLGALVRDENDEEHAEFLASLVMAAANSLVPVLRTEDRLVMAVLTSADLAAGAAQPGVLLFTETRAIHVPLKITRFFKFKITAMPANVVTLEELRSHELGTSKPVRQNDRWWVGVGTVDSDRWRVLVDDAEDECVSTMILALIYGSARLKFDGDVISGIRVEASPPE